MSTEIAPKTPIFGSEESEYLLPNAPPLSVFAVISLLLGLVSSLSILSITLILLPVLAIAIGCVASLQLARNDNYRGRWMANTGLGLGLAFAIWTVTATQLRDQRLYSAAAEFSTHALKLLAENKRYEVYELTQPESRRQLASANLAEHYEALQGEAKDSFETFFKDPLVQQVFSRGSSPDWRFVRGNRIVPIAQGEMGVDVDMEEVSQNPPLRITARLIRYVQPPMEGSKPTATWSFLGVKN